MVRKKWDAGGYCHKYRYQQCNGGEDSSIRVMYMYIWCLHREGGGGQKADAVRKLSKGGCVKMQIREGWVKKSQNFADILCTWPNTPFGSK